jgi:K+-transporting ATPase ATPase A chain
VAGLMVGRTPEYLGKKIEAYEMKMASLVILIPPLIVLVGTAIAGSLARKKHTPPGAGTLPTHRPLFVVMVVSTILLVGALTFVPALALGPVVEHLQMITP